RLGRRVECGPRLRQALDEPFEPAEMFSRTEHFPAIVGSHVLPRLAPVELQVRLHPRDPLAVRELALGLGEHPAEFNGASDGIAGRSEESVMLGVHLCGQIGERSLDGHGDYLRRPSYQDRRIAQEHFYATRDASVASTAGCPPRTPDGHRGCTRDST